MPSYLIAIVVGVLEQREIGPRSAVWAEPSVVEKSAKVRSMSDRVWSSAKCKMHQAKWY